MEGKYIAGIAAIVVAVILVGSVLAPVIDTVSGGAWDETITTTYNEDPDLQFDKQTSDFALNMSVTIGDNVVITNGEDTVTATYGAMFLLAADNSAVFISMADDLIFTWSDNDGNHSLTLAGDFTAVIADDKLTINDGTAYDAPLPASYLYVPSSTGGYGSFASGDLAKRAADPVIAAGSFAGAVAYNSSVTFVGDNMIMSVDGTDTLINSVEWVAAPAAEPAVVPFDPSSITIQPLDPSVLDPTPDASIMSVPTPIYTDGDWGYDLITSGENTGKAIIVSYSGTGGDVVTIPATVGGYDVVQLGKGGANQNIINTTTVINKLVIPEGVQTIAKAAFKNCNKITGTLEIPNSVTTIGQGAFDGCSGFTGPLILHENMTIANVAFSGCSGFTGQLIIPDGVTLGAGVFDGCSGFTGNAVIPETAVWSVTNNTFLNCSGLDGTIVILSNVTSLGQTVFWGTSLQNMIIQMSDTATFDSTAFNNTQIKNILNIGTAELITTSYGLNADVIQDYIGADCYIAPATLTEVIHHSGGGGGGMGAMYAAIPVVIITAILLAAVSMFVIRRGM